MFDAGDSAERFGRDIARYSFLLCDMLIYPYDPLPYRRAIRGSQRTLIRVSFHRGDNVEGILYKLDESESSDSSDSAYQGRAGPQQRRVQPRRA